MASKISRLAIRLAEYLNDAGIVNVEPAKLAPVLMASLHKEDLLLTDIDPERTLPQRR